MKLNSSSNDHLSQSTNHLSNPQSDVQSNDQPIDKKAEKHFELVWREFRFRCPIVGRKHTKINRSESVTQLDDEKTRGSPTEDVIFTVDPSLDQSDLKQSNPVCFVREPYNPRDSCAILVHRWVESNQSVTSDPPAESGDKQIVDSTDEKSNLVSVNQSTAVGERLGHVSARLAASLAPLLDIDCLIVQAYLTNNDLMLVDSELNGEMQIHLSVKQSWLDEHVQHYECSQPNVRSTRHVNELLKVSHYLHNITEVIDTLSDHSSRFVSNFLLVTQIAFDRYRHIFHPSERQAISLFQSIDESTQHLYCRLMLRKQASSPILASAMQSVSQSSNQLTVQAWPSRWIAVSSIRYQSVKDVSHSIQQLRQPFNASEYYLPPLEIDFPEMDYNEAATYQSLHSAVDSTVDSNFGQVDELDEAFDSEESLINLSENDKSVWPEFSFVETSSSTSMDGLTFYQTVFECVPMSKLRQFCSKAGLSVKWTGTAQSIKQSLLTFMQKQRTLTGYKLIDCPRCRKIFHTECGEFIRLQPKFLLLCQRLYRLFFLSDAVGSSSISSASSPMVLEDLGKVKWVKVPINVSDNFPLFPDRACFLAYDAALHVRDCMSFAIDDFDADFRAGHLHMPLALACLCYAWQALQMEHHHATSSLCFQFDVHSLIKEVDTTLSGTNKYFSALGDVDFSRFTQAQGSFHPYHARGLTHVFESQYRASWIYADICYYGITLLERIHRYQEATSLLYSLLSLPYCVKRRGHWWNRLALNLATHHDLKSEALAVAKLGILDPHVRTGDRFELESRVKRLSQQVSQNKETKKQTSSSSSKRSPTSMSRQSKSTNKRKSHHRSPSPSLSTCQVPSIIIRGRPLNREAGSKSRFVGLSGEFCSVEELVLEFYAQDEQGNWFGEHCENALFSTLFGLLMWDCIFAPLPNVFHSSYQNAPLDLNTDSFYSQRVQMITRTLNQIINGCLDELIRFAYWRHLNERCRGVNWHRWTCEELIERAQAIGNVSMASICRILSEDYAHWQGGLPDLFLFKPPSAELPTLTTHVQNESDDECQIIETVPIRSLYARLVEVKGPRDRLSSQQRAWLNQLAPFIQVECCFVREEHDDSSLIYD